jgi:hypothetical protein
MRSIRPAGDDHVMACGGCSERRAAIVSGVKSLARGEVAPALRQAQIVAQSAARDIGRLRLAAAHARLKR